VPAVAPPEHDRPRLDQVLAWKRGEAIFENVSLQDALAEMNRYSSMPISVDARVADLPVSGLFKTGENVGFAHAVAKLHGLRVRERPEGLELVPG
jgi:transmembrane sensor